MSEATVRLAEILGAKSMIDPASLSGEAGGKRIERLVRLFMHAIDTAEMRERQGRDATLRRGDVLALALACRVLLRPEVQDIVREEMKRDSQWN
jgi:hypothetical protein